MNSIDFGLMLRMPKRPESIRSDSIARFVIETSVLGGQDAFAHRDWPFAIFYFDESHICRFTHMDIVIFSDSTSGQTSPGWLSRDPGCYGSQKT